MLIGLVQQHTKLPTKNFIGQNARYLSFRIAKRVAKKKRLCSDLYVNEEPVFSLKTLLWCSIQQKMVRYSPDLMESYGTTLASFGWN